MLNGYYCYSSAVNSLILTYFYFVGSGKTTIVMEIIKNRKELFEQPPSGVIYCYSQFQELFNDIQQDSEITFFYGLPSAEDVEGFIQKFKNNFFLLILDDLMDMVTNSKIVADIASRLGHHSKIGLLYISQNVFSQGSKARDISLNSHFFILLRTRRDIKQISILGGQLFQNSSEFTNVYLDAVENPISERLPPFLLVNCHPRGDRNYSLISNLFPLSDVKVVYRLD